MYVQFLTYTVFGTASGTCKIAESVRDVSRKNPTEAGSGISR
jgi:hypothetical protein